jgi:uncharacterized protein (TIGR02284 family)
MEHSNAISVLNNLIETTRDGENGFRTAASAVKDSHLKALFQRFERQRAEMVRELQSEVKRLGGDPEKMGSVSGSLHRGWINIKSLVTGGDDAAIISEAERGEDAAKRAFEDALKADLPAGTRELVQQQSAIVHTAHDEVRALEKTHAH